MNFNNHGDLQGQHAYLSASSYHWVNYSDDKVAETYKKHLATLMGTRLHAYAAECIELCQKLPKSNKTLNLYVNDCIGFRMTPEQVLYYSKYCFGTADAISFRDSKLKIFDLKTGMTPAHIEQLMVYDALFCLEYDVKPGDIQHELRIYQFDDKVIYGPTVDEIAHVMDRIVTADKIISQINQEVNV